MKMTIGLRATQNCNDVTVEIFVDQKLISCTTAQSKETVTEISLPNTPMDHQVELRMSGKTQQHTVVDDHGNIESDVAFIIETLKIQDIDMKPVFCQGRKCYFHSANNPTGEEIQDELYDYIGWNGSVRLEFFTPIYLWMSDYF